MVSCLDLGKKVLIVYAHQEPRSLNGSLKDVAVAELSQQGCTVTVSDLYAMNFEPRATVKKKVCKQNSSLEVMYNSHVEKNHGFSLRFLNIFAVITGPQQKWRPRRCYSVWQVPLFKMPLPAVPATGVVPHVFTFFYDPPGVFTRFLHGKLAILSLTTGGTASMFSKTGVNGDFRYFLWPLQHGTLHFCGFKVLAPQISFSPEMASEEERKRMVASWAQRLKTVWEEEPIPCSPPWYFGQ
ncbi:hypothetical protein K5549_004001 [Capra hircus]|nr:hypothetical protein K5549_004001 [Capra hircus]